MCTAEIKGMLNFYIQEQLKTMTEAKNKSEQDSDVKILDQIGNCSMSKELK